MDIAETKKIIRKYNLAKWLCLPADEKQCATALTEWQQLVCWQHPTPFHSLAKRGLSLCYTI